MLKKPVVAVIIPVYNPPEHWGESCFEHILALSKFIPDFTFRFVFVGDGTPRGGFKELKLLLKNSDLNFKIHLLSKNYGKGKALKVGVAKTQADFYLCVDWDFPFGVPVFGEILKQFSLGADVVIINRGENYSKSLPNLRRFVNSIWRYYIKHGLGLPFSDTQGGTRGFSEKGKPVFLGCKLDRFLHTVEFIVSCLRSNLTIVEVAAELKPGINFTNFSLSTYLRELREFLPYLSRLRRDLRPVRKITINADDFGMNHYVNAGIIKGIQRGRISNVSLIVTMPGFNEAVRFLKRHSKVPVSLHFSLTEGKPISNAFSDTPMVKRNRFQGLLPLMLQWIRDPDFITKYEKELSAQLKKVIDTGIKIHRLDSHQHVHMLPFILPNFISFALKSGIEKVRLTRVTVRDIFMLFSYPPSLRQFVIVGVYTFALLFVSDDLIKKLSPITDEGYFFDINWHNRFSEKSWGHFLATAPNKSIELICHPSIKARNLPEFDKRAETLKFLLQGQTMRLLEEYGFILS